MSLPASRTAGRNAVGAVARFIPAQVHLGADQFGARTHVVQGNLLVQGNLPRSPLGSQTNRTCRCDKVLTSNRVSDNYMNPD
jgi:hypothetical protein